MEHLYKRKFIIMIIIGLIIIAWLKADAKHRRKQIPNPILEVNQNLEISQGELLTIRGKGFINNYPSIHKVTLTRASARKVQKIKLPVVSSNANYLLAQIPRSIVFGDYDLSVKIQSKYLKSDRVQSNDKLFVRPAAPLAPKLSYQVLSSDQELVNLLEPSDDIQQELNGDLQIGINQVFQTYTRDGFKSLRSPMTSFYYLPERSMEDTLKVDSESPLKSFAIEKFNNQKFDVSNITNSEIEELSKSFFLKTLSQPRYLEYSVILSPVFLEQIHPFEDEFAVIKNRSSNEFALNGCLLADSIQNRYKFANKDLVPAKQSLTITQNLGLNNASPDSLKLLCPDTNGSLSIIDEFRYEKIDADGFGIRS